ncbi:ABC transporter substrate-binding protein [Amycolatopsis tucumanensis]|uniref:Aliphatic sulfonate ABC transporter substrate-binding protein n=1 Tax=Amycolatopsis tucumanensis TaxID=401106 RepID=A0ABP7HHN6_9PSEU|nr:ABC transporter substrate-binding protein [Amycolatopsis tucumanensis]MCF6425394.1 ABC transporter substrate-binding protein [Amycolatopsis tucumanensis]
MTVRIGFFPNNNSLFVLRHRGIVERRLPAVEWVDLRALPAKPPVDPKSALPTLHSDWLFEPGGYDFIGTGFTPPVTGLAHDRDLVYVGISGPRVENGRLVVKPGSPIRTVADLRGRRVGVAHGSWQTTLLLFALEGAGLTWSDIEPVDTAVHDGPSAFSSGELDAWVGAYPALGVVEQAGPVRTLIETEGLFSHPSLWFTRRDFAENHRDELTAIVRSLQESDAWVEANPREAARYFAEDAGTTSEADLDRWEHALRSRPFGLHPVSEEFLDEQHRAARLLAANGLLPRAVDPRSAVLPWLNDLLTPQAA